LSADFYHLIKSHRKGSIFCLPQ